MKNPFEKWWGMKKVPKESLEPKEKTGQQVPTLDKFREMVENVKGLPVEDILVGQKVEIRTQNHTYLLERREDGFYISGNPEIFPEPTKVIIHGSTLGGANLWQGVIGKGMNLELLVPDRPLNRRVVTTSSVQEITEVGVSKYIN